MQKLSKKEAIEHLSRFRAASDSINDDLTNLSSKLLNMLTDLENKLDKTPEEQAICLKLGTLVEDVIRGTISSNEYNNSLWKDYTKVIKALGSSTDGDSNE
ncbi:hypothetical protein [Yersinia ruckeri]|uniref:Uncharacterized protein n=1 Tax=Yersinia ruckeri TaxID=29486 RepID=A0A380S9M9_YERRU|nr:hypothetical protein [Yersinia ruckeri]EKN4208083.1 hypothetical protein [Yersinia ruckeri]EKN4693296.1 hypothetical protein [Yersinia ruckeri]MCK8596532.1 hypothetical protein [Yersinia ruckeri]MCK8598003.1 hypothetical protein [Yersinia ruckeri]MCW6612381.1 hypothetical protein [Yersinia ruckeri]